VAIIEWLHRGGLARDSAGGKGAALSELLAAGFEVPLGFCLGADAYRAFTAAGGLDARVEELLTAADAVARGPGDVAEAIAGLVRETPLPDELCARIAEAYDELASLGGLACAVRSSAVSEDGAAASFAGLYESYLNVQGIEDVIDSVRRYYTSLWSERAVGYRIARSGGAREAMAVVVMGMVPSETSGIAFTAHPVTGDRDVVVINSSWGLGEAIVSGRVTPDSFVVRKGTLALAEREVFEKSLAIYPHPDGAGTIERAPDRRRAIAPSLTDDEVREVARVAAAVETHYGRPQDIEWGMTAGQLFILQSRPITTL
jgi:pyruvate,water dikinase